MAFTTKQFYDLRGILFLMLLTIPSIATTNIDCNGKAFHCVNSTHFMICVDLGSGVTSTMDNFIIPCPGSTECHNTNRFECEFLEATTQIPTSETLTVTTGQTTTATLQASEPTVQFVPEITTTIPFEDFYNTVSTTTISGSELSNPNPTFITDSTTIDVFDKANVSTSGSHADFEVSERTIDVLNTTSSTQDVISETIVSSVITDSSVDNTTDNAINFTQTDSYVNAINKMITVNLDVGITMTEQNTAPTFTTTERVSFITENVTETNINSVSETELVTGNINSSNSTQNQAVYTTESPRSDTQVDNITASTTEIRLDQSIITNNQDQLRTDKANETTVTVKNPLENELVNAENTITTSTVIPNEYTVTDAVTKQTSQIYATTETFVTLGIPSDLSISTESIIVVEPNTLIENKVIVNQETTSSSVDRGTIEKTLLSTPKINEMPIQNATLNNNNLGNVATASISDSEVITGPSSELQIAVISSTAPTTDTTLNTETINDQDSLSSIKNTNVISTSKLNVTTEAAITNDKNNNNIVDNIPTISLPSTNSPSLTTEKKIVSTESTNFATIQNKIVVHSLEIDLKTSSENLFTLVTTEKTLELNPTVTESGVSESNINFVSNVLKTQPSKVDPALQQLEVSNKPDKDTNVPNINSQHTILSNIDLSADNQDIKTKSIITEPPFTGTEKYTDYSDVNTGIQYVEYNSLAPQRENGKPKIETTQTTESSNDIVSNSYVILEPSVTSLPVLPTETFLYLDTRTPEKATKSQVIRKSMDAGDSDQLNSQNNEKSNLTKNYVAGSNRKADQLFIDSEMNNIAKTPNEKALNFSENKTNFVSNVNTLDTQTSKLDPALQQLKVSNKPDKDTNVLGVYSPLNILSNIDSKADNLKTDKSTTAGEFNQLNGQNNEKNDSITNYVTGSNIKADQLYTDSETNSIGTTPNEKAPNFNIIIEPTRYEIPTTPQNGETKTQLQDQVEIDALRKTATETNNSPKIAADGKLVNIESTNFENDQTKIQPTVEVTTYENRLTLATSESIFALNPMVADFPVSESNLFLDSTIHVQIPKALLTKAIDITNKHTVNAAEIGSEKFNKLEPKGYETPMIETQTQLREIEFNTQQQKVPKTISGITRSIAEYDTISKLPVTESTRNVNVDVPSQIATPDSILQLTPSSVLENTEKINSKSIIENSPDFIKTKDDNKKYPTTGDLTSGNIPTISISEYFDNKVQDYAVHQIASPQNQIPIVNLLENTHYITNIKLSEGLPTLQTPIEQMTTKSTFAGQNNIETIKENPQDKASNNTNTAAISANNSVPLSNNTNKLTFKTDNINKTNNQRIGVPIVENTVINLTPSSAVVIKKIPDEFHVVTDTIAYSKINHEIQPQALSQSATLPQLSSMADFSIPKTYIAKQNIIKQEGSYTTKSISKELKNAVVNEGERTKADTNSSSSSTSYSDTNGRFIPAEFTIQPQGISQSATLPQLSSMADFSIPKTYIAKQNIIKQEGPYTTISIPKELKNAVVYEGERTKADTNSSSSSTSYSDTNGRFIPAEFAKGSDVINKSIGLLNNKTSTENSFNLVKFNESTLTLVGKHMDQSSAVGNETKVSEGETIQTRNKLESPSIVGLVETAPTQTLDILKFVLNTADITSTPVSNIYNSEKNKGPNYEAVLTATQTMKSLQIVGSYDNTASKVFGTENKNEAHNTASSVVSLKDGNQNTKKGSDAKIKSLAERDLSTTSNKLSTTQIKFTSKNSQQVNNNAGEAVNLALFDLLSNAKSGGFAENNNKPSSEKPDDEETTARENRQINKDSSFTTLSSESLSVTTESVEGDNNEIYNNNIIVRSNSKYETLTSKPTIEISARPTQVVNLKNIQQLPIVHEVSTQSTVRSTSQKLSLENNTPLPATTKAITNNFICKFNQRGRFADNHDCRKFYICHGRPQPLEGICPIYTVFSELRKQCTKNLSHCVRNNQFQCMSEGRFSDFLNDNIYYICAKNKLSTFIRFKLRCQNGYHLNKTSVRCVLNTELISQSISSDISKSNSEQSAALKLVVKDSKSKDSNKNKFVCEEEGKFANPDNCRVYFVCKTSKSGYLRKKKKCDSDENFHKDKKKCVDAESYECK